MKCRVAAKRMNQTMEIRPSAYADVFSRSPTHHPKVAFEITPVVFSVLNAPTGPQAGSFFVVMEGRLSFSRAIFRERDELKTAGFRHQGRLLSP